MTEQEQLLRRATRLLRLTYDREMQDIFAIRSDIAKRVADALKIELGVGAQQGIRKNPTDNLEAHNLYLKGRYYTAKATKATAAALCHARRTR